MARIILGGRPGSGKTAVSQFLADITGYEYFSVGRNLTRPLADQFGMQVGEFYSKYSQPDARITLEGKSWQLDDYLDSKQVEWAAQHPNSVIESRLGWYFIPQDETTLSVLLHVSPVVAAERIMKNQRPEERYCDINIAINSIEARLAQEQETYKRKYNIENYLDPVHYDLMINTDKFNAWQVGGEILKEMRDSGLLFFR